MRGETYAMNHKRHRENGGRMGARWPGGALVGVLAAAMIAAGAGCGRNAGEPAKAPGAVQVWWEAENAVRTDFQPPQSEPGPGGDILSEGKWIGVGEGFTGTAFLEYEVEVPEAGAYRFFARKFWKHGPFRWRFDDQEWQRVTEDVALLDEAYIRKFWGANWVKAGDARLGKGKHTLRIEVGPSEKPFTAYFDCFLLTTGRFHPLGKIKPGEPMPAPEEGWSSFNQYDTLFAPSPIDLRPLNEAQAGDNGFVGVRGEDFVQDGKPVRFLGVGASRENTLMPREEIDALAKFLARKGVNFIRYHSPIVHRDGPKAGEVRDDDLDKLFYLIAAMKREGIYTHLSTYFPVWFHPGESGRFAGYAPDKPPFALSYFSEEFQEMQRGWWRALLARENPHTGKALKDDPCVMGFEIINEDSLFFWTFDYKNIPDEQALVLESKFGAWLDKKYGGIGAAFAAWNAPHPRDNAAEKRAGFVPMWEYAQGATPRRKDTARFLAETQKDYYDRAYRFLRNEIGFKGAICGSNWRTANTVLFGAMEKWTQIGCDFMDHHGYWGGWAAHDEAGNVTYAPKSLSAWDSGPGGEQRELSLPFLNPVVAGKPNMVSEYAWIGWHDLRAEMAPLVAALASQAGMDALPLFALDSVTAWRSTVKQSWPVLTPSSIAMFPAKALVFRLGLVGETKPLVTVKVNVEAMLDLSGNAFPDPSSNDANRANEGRDASRQAVETEHFANGKVAVDFTTSAPSQVEKPNTASFHDPARGVLKSASGQIEWPYKRGIFTVRAPQTQAVSGYLGRAGKVELPDLTVESPMDFGVVWAVAMDGKPVAASKKILLQAMSREQNHGFKTEGFPKRKVLDFGMAPIEIKNIEGTVRFLRKDAAGLKVTPLDINGCPKGQATRGGTVNLQPDTIYYLIEK